MIQLQFALLQNNDDDILSGSQVIDDYFSYFVKSVKSVSVHFEPFLTIFEPIRKFQKGQIHLKIGFDLAKITNFN